jgi:hypothetical protein
VIAMPKMLVLVLFLLACHVSSAVAQAGDPNPRVERLQPQWAHAVWAAGSDEALGRQARDPLGGLLGPADEDYRYTGFFIGAGLGVASTMFSVTWCSDPDNACSRSHALLMGAMFTAMAGFGGAVLGGLFPK